jgi:spore germination protein GerM
MMARRHVVAACIGVLVGLAGVSCGVPVDDQTQVIPSDDVPFELLEPAPTTTTSTTVVEAGSTTTMTLDLVLLYFVRADKVVRIEREVSEALGVKDRLVLLTTPVTATEAEHQLRSAVPPGSINDVELDRGVATVDLSPSFTEISGLEQVLAFAQITLTLSQLPGIGQVAFTRNGEPVQPLDVQGTVIPGPVTSETYLDLLAS